MPIFNVVVIRTDGSEVEIPAPQSITFLKPDVIEVVSATGRTRYVTITALYTVKAA